ncbi:PQQ-binding-like beta-propeller repeat protein [Streptomyces sp. NPDC035033]|uniref:outer membrane protein assembly factor BamB family protein n=1 Tax=Streptomyces sp. NPDC035033 TaxID=3155368 RepID=UPI0033CC3F15
MATTTRSGGRADGKTPGGKGGKGGSGGGNDSGGGKPGSRAARYAVVGGVLLALLAGCGGITAGILASEGYLPGDSMRQVWETPVDDHVPGPTSGHGTWAVGDTLVRSRATEVTGFDARSGARRWRYAPAGDAAVCSVSRTAEDGVALIAQGSPETPGGEPAAAAGKGCTTVVALDLGSGRELWRAARTPASGEIQDEKDLVAVGGGLAVVRDEDPDWPYAWAGERPGSVRPDRALRALDLRTGKPRWAAAVPKDCVPHRVAAGQRQVLALLVCERRDVRLAAFDPADGRHRWTTPLDERRYVEPIVNEAAFLSADPIAVSVDGLDLSGYPSVLSFSDDGRLQGRIASDVANGRLSTAEPAHAEIAYGRLYAVDALSRDTVSAFDLRTGRRLWHARLGYAEDVLGLRVADGRVTALVDLYAHSAEDGLLVLDADTGEERDMRTFPDSFGGSFGEITDVLGHGNLLIAARTDGFRPFTAYEER